MKTNTRLRSYISLNSHQNKKLFKQKVVDKIKTHVLCSTTFFENHAVYENMWRNTVLPDTPQMTIWPMRIACT
jgi:hypothetical protein